MSGGYSPPPTPDPLNVLLDSGTLGTIQSPIVIGTIENAPLVTTNVGTINVIGTIENAPLITAQGAVSASVEYPITIATIENAPLITVQGALSASIEYPVAISTIENAPLITAQGAVSASVEYPVTVTSVGTILNAPLVTVQGALSASIEYPITVTSVGTILNAPLITAQGAVSASVEYPVTVSSVQSPVTVNGTVQAAVTGQFPSASGQTLGTVLSVGTVAVQVWSSTVLADALTIRNMPSTPPTKLPAVYVGNSTSQWFYLESGAALTLNWVNPSSVYVLAAATGGTVFVIYNGA